MYEAPIEEFIQYTDRKGNNYVASKPKDLEPWFNDMIERYGLNVLVNMFPYVTLVIDQETGLLKTWNSCRYNAKITNAFHILLAKKMDEKYNEDNQEEFALDLERFFPKVDTVEEKNIEYNKESIIEDTPKTGYSIDYEHMPDQIKIQSPAPNSHPNKDAYGNYRSPKPPIQSYNWNNNQYYSYLPRYQTFNQFPIITR